MYTSIVDYLNSQKKDSSYAARKVMAASMGISNYTGTATQNTQMLNMLQAPKTTTTTTIKPTTTIAPVKTATINTGIKPSGTTTAKSTSTLNTQKMLLSKGYNPGPLDGIWGPLTQAAYDKYQTDLKAQETKTAGLIAGANANSTPTKTTSTTGAGNVLGSTIFGTNTKDPYNQALGDYTNKINSLIGEMNQQQTPVESEKDFMARMTEIINNILKMQQAQQQANTEKARTTTLSDASTGKRQLDDVYAKQLLDLEQQAQKIRDAYASGSRNIETNKAETLPEFQSAMTQQDIKAQRAQKVIEDAYAKRGLNAGGQVMSDIAGNQNANLTAQGEIQNEQTGFLRDTANKKADLEASQASGLSDVEGMKGEAATNLASGKRDIIDRVNAALSNLTTDEKTALDNLALQRANMVSGLTDQYRDMTNEERDRKFNELLQQAGVAQSAVSTITGLIDDINKAKANALEYQIKQLEFQYMPKQIELERKTLLQDLEANRISIDTAKQELNNLKNGLTRSGGQPSGTAEEPPEEYDYTTDEDWLQNIQNINNGEVSLEDIDANAKQFIKDYTYKGYLELRKRAGG